MGDSELLVETQGLLQNRKLSLREISEKTGINFHWLSKFKQGKFDDPGVKKIEQLHTFLTESAD